MEDIILGGGYFFYYQYYWFSSREVYKKKWFQKSATVGAFRWDFSIGIP
jgi:hypothetical protein